MAELYGLIFDVDGVIADTEGVNARASIQVFVDLFGIDGVKREDFEAGLGRGAEAYMIAAATVHGLEMTPEQVEQSTAKREENFLKILEVEPLPAFPGILELIAQALDRPDFRLGIATSSSRQMSGAVLRSAGVPFERMTWITGDKITHKKPNPEIFLTCARGMDVPPEQCVVVEDTPSGVAAARAAGSKCIAVTNSTGPENLSQADLIVRCMTEVDVDRVIRLIRGV
ncbi:MAG TPA: HAD family phosphatase [bacterium]|nr:HAD family phosphatase [bacterium]HPO07050.1 HAD family phosphatase [bacterium]HQO33504.1 HAD family phosphatase [bacterium]HQP97189.1 HAD family phosphatase [bacterium]